MSNISRALTLLRKYHRIKQYELAEHLDISNPYLCEIEKGRKSANLELLQKYSDFFEIPVSSILYLSERMDSDKGLSGSFRVGSARVILRMLEWSVNKEAGL